MASLLDGQSGRLPDVWDLVYKAALASAKGAAVEEMLGNVTAALKSYSKARPVASFNAVSGK